MNASDPTLRISQNHYEFDVTMIHRFLSTESSWARGIDLACVQRSIEYSLCFGAFLGSQQVGFARVVTDRATFANLVDVFVLPAQRLRGIGKALVEAVMAHPDLQKLRRFTLATSDAHALYARFGFAAPLRSNTLMEIYVPDIYARNTD